MATELLKIEEIQNILHIGRNKTYELLKSGKIKGFKIGREWKATAESVEEYIDTLVKRKDEK